MLKLLTRNAIRNTACGLLIAGAGTALADPWGTNAPVCPLGRCAPVRGSWGYYPTKWRQWPGAVYPDMTPPAARPDAGQIQPPDTELPAADKETGAAPNGSHDAASPFGGMGSPGGAGSGGMGSPGGGGAAITPSRGRGADPTPAKMPLDTMPGEMPTPRSGPGANPLPDEPNFGPPSFNGPPAGPSNRSSGTPKTLPRFPAQESIGAAGEMKAQRSSRVSWSDRNDLPTARVSLPRGTVDNSGLPLSPDSEPDMIVPSLSSRPLNTTSADSRIDRSAGGNPLRDDLRTDTGLRTDTVLPASLTDADPPSPASNRSTTPPVNNPPTLDTASPLLGTTAPLSAAPTSTTSSLRSNPLRRN